MTTLALGAKSVEVDAEGYLKRIQDWSEELAFLLAEQEKIELTQDHWDVLLLIRDFYLEFNTSPPLRMLVKLYSEKKGAEKGNSSYLFSLFPEGPAKQAAKLAGLPKPVRCL
ncbi:MAG: TusE/DsrC/DsvC family sulfur relay protein [Enterovibrio sp.]